MPLPAVAALAALAAEIAGVVAVTASVIGLATSIRDSLQQAVAGLVGDVLIEGVEEVIKQAAKQQLGLTLDDDDPLSPESLTRALSEKTGIEFTDISDAEQTQKDVLEFAIEKIATEAGIELDGDDLTIEGVIAAIKERALEEIISRIEAEDIEGLDALLDAILGKYCEKEKDRDPDERERKRLNRERQRRFRESNPHLCDC
jgi:transcriptional regulator with XRE-family HTH domain